MKNTTRGSSSTHTHQEWIHVESSQDWPRYRIFGLTLASDYPFGERLLASGEKPHLFFTLVSRKPTNDSWEDTEPTYLSPLLNPAGDPLLTFYNLSEFRVMHYAGIADFYLNDRVIICHIFDASQQDLAALHILPAVISIWMEMKDRVVSLHASAVVVDQQAIAFLGHSRHGKSTLAATFTQAGYPLLTDDILLVEDIGGEFKARPGYPFMRLWPDEAKLFTGVYEEFEHIQEGYDKRRVPIGNQHFGKFTDRATSLGCIYLAQRRTSEEESESIHITMLPPRQAVIDLIRFAYSSRLSEALGRSYTRLDFFARLAGQVPVRRLSFPSGHKHLPAVLSALLADLQDQS